MERSNAGTNRSRESASAGNAVVAGRCAAAGGGLRGALQQPPPEQCHRLHHAEGHARRASGEDPCRARSEAGGGAKTAADSPATGRVTKMPISPCSVKWRTGVKTTARGVADCSRVLILLLY